MPDVNSVIKTKRKKKKKQNIFAAIFQGLIPWKGDSVGEIVRKIVFLVSLVLLAVTGFVILDTYVFAPARDTTKYNEEILTLYNQAPTKEQVEQLPEKSINTKYAPLYAANNDFVGWIEIVNTSVNYPVVQGKDNEEYLHMGYNKEYSYSGTLFADYENVFSPTEPMSANTIIYGHNMLVDSFFTEVARYYSPDYGLDYFKERAVINFNTLYENASYKIFSVMLLNTTDNYGEVFPYQTKINFSNREQFNDFVAECFDRSKYYTGVDVKYGDELLTLSTCEFKSGLSDMRVVVLARKVRDGESAEFTEEEKNAFFENPAPKLCDTMAEWYPPFEKRYWDPAWLEGYKKDDSFADINDINE